MKIITVVFIVLCSLSSYAWAGDKDLLASLPPDPDEAGKLTLEGIDSDHDGVRDDVQRWITLTYSNSEKTRAALIQQAKTMQLVLLDASYPTKSLNHASQLSRGISCLSYILSEKFYDVAMEHKAVFLDTYARNKAWFQADKHSSGKIFTALSYKKRKQGCDFDPDALPN